MTILITSTTDSRTYRRQSISTYTSHHFKQVITAANYVLFDVLCMYLTLMPVIFLGLRKPTVNKETVQYCATDVSRNH